MKYIREHGEAFDLDRTFSKIRQDYLRNYVEAQMVMQEDIPFSGWFYWNFKMEGGYAAEWDFLRGVKEGWIPQLPEANVNAKEVFGQCWDIMFRTSDDFAATDPYPKERPKTVTGYFDDDEVNHRAHDMYKLFGKWYEIKPKAFMKAKMAALGLLVVAGVFFYLSKKRRRGYTKIEDAV